MSDCIVMFEVLLNMNAYEFLTVLRTDDFVLDFELELMFRWIEYRVPSLLWVGGEVVDIEVVNEFVKCSLCKSL